MVAVNKRRNAFTEQHKAEIISLMKQGNNIQETAQEVGCSPGTVGLALKRWGLFQEKPITEEDIINIHKMILEGKIMKEISAETGIKAKRLPYIFKKYGLKLQTFREHNRDRIIELQNQGKLPKEIAEEIGCSEIGIRKVLRDFGLKPNTKPSLYETHKDTIIEMYKEGKSLNIISKATGISASWVKKIVIRLKEENLI